ncbi:MAG: O-antigen ligase family protein, partial [Balneolales bacterium]
MTGNTSLSEFAFYRYRNLIIVSAVLVYGLVAYLSYATGITWLPLLAIGVFFAGVFAFLSLKEPYYILLFVAVGSYLGNLVHLIEDGAVPVTIFQILLVMGFLFFVVHRLMASDLEIKLLGIELELMLFLALIFLSIVYTPNPESGMLNAIRFLILIATAYLVVNIVRSQNQITGILALLVAVSVVLAAIALRETILNPTAAAMEFMSAGNLENRAKGTQVDPNIFASHFFLPIAFVSSLFLSLKSYMYRVPAFIILGILSLGLLSTFSRSAWVAAAVMLVLTAYFQRQLKLFVWLFGVALVAILFIPELQYTALNVLERIMDIFAGSSDNSSRIRILLGIAAMGMLFDSYLLGVGFRGFPEVFPNYFS